jgi:tetratricopeptide (TPR) repeat protein
VLALALLAWPAEFFTERARILLRDEEYPDAIASATQALHLDPWNPFTCLHLGEALRLQAELEPVYADRQARREGAERAFQQGLRLFPQDENLLVRRGQVLDRLKRFDEAEASFQAALAADPLLDGLRQLYEKHRALRDPARSDSAR